jgi:hypothetical protein
LGETVKTEVSFHGRCGMIKISSYSKALSIGLNFATLTGNGVTSIMSERFSSGM